MPSPQGRQLPGAARSFVVRIWREQPLDVVAASGRAPVLRGSVQRVGGDAVRYFTTLDTLVRIIALGVDLEVDDAGSAST
jgi:hypothetical protein